MAMSSYVIQWREEMYNVATERFREVGTYFYTNVAFKYPFPHERECNLFYVEPAQEPIEGDDEEDGDVDEDISEVVTQPEAVPVPVLHRATQVALMCRVPKEHVRGDTRRRRQHS
jgi:hypothetical protein